MSPADLMGLIVALCVFIALVLVLLPVEECQYCAHCRKAKADREEADRKRHDDWLNGRRPRP